MRKWYLICLSRKSKEIRKLKEQLKSQKIQMLELKAKMTAEQFINRF